MGAGASSGDTGVPERARDTETALTGGVGSAISQAFNMSAAAHPEWRQIPPAVSEIVQSIAHSMLAMAEKNQSVVGHDLPVVWLTNDPLQARGLGGVESAISQAINTSVAAHPEWRRVPPAVYEIVQSIAQSMLAMAETNQPVEGDDSAATRSTNNALRARGKKILGAIRMQRLARSSVSVASEYKQLLSVRGSPRTTPARSTF